MKKQFLILCAIASIAISSCGAKSNQETPVVVEANTTVDSTTTGTIAKMWWDKSSGMGGVVMSNGKSLSFVTDYLGANNSGRLFINAEVKDILTFDKENPKEKLNLKYLDKKVKVTWVRNGEISKIELLGGEEVKSSEQKTSIGLITALKDGTELDYGNFIDFNNDNGNAEKYRLYVEGGKGRPNVTPVFTGQGKVANFIFFNDHYIMKLTPASAERKVKITYENKLVENFGFKGTRAYFFNEVVVTKIEWAE